MKIRVTEQLATIRKVLGGFLIGIAFLLPGVSGGALAVSLGYFESGIAAISNLRKAPRKSVTYLMPLLVGGLVGVGLSAFFVAHWMNTAETQAVSLFLGMVAGSIPSLYRDANPVKPDAKHVLLILLGAVVTLVMFFLEPIGDGGTQQTVTVGMSLLAGVIYGIGAIIPGISSTFFLLYLGWYRPIINAMVSLNIGVLLPVGVMFAATTLAFIKAVDWLFKRYRRNMLNLIIGFAVGSLVLVYPNEFWGAGWWINALLTLLGLAAGILLGRIPKTENEQS